LFWDPGHADVKLWQTYTLLRQLEKLAAARSAPPLLLCGDFNSEPHVAVARLLGGNVAAGRPRVSLAANDVPPDPAGILVSLLRGRRGAGGAGSGGSGTGGGGGGGASSAVSAGAGPGATVPLSHSLMLASAYAAVQGVEPPFTNLTGGWTGVLDYIWFSAESLLPVAVLAVPTASELTAASGTPLPNPQWPSDHLCLCADFALVPPERRGVRAWVAENQAAAAATAASAAAAAVVAATAGAVGGGAGVAPGVLSALAGGASPGPAALLSVLGLGASSSAGGYGVGAPGPGLDGGGGGGGGSGGAATWWGGGGGPAPGGPGRAAGGGTAPGRGPSDAFPGLGTVRGGRW
jgi:hypothetical protein